MWRKMALPVECDAIVACAGDRSPPSSRGDDDDGGSRAKRSGTTGWTERSLRCASAIEERAPQVVVDEALRATKGEVVPDILSNASNMGIKMEYDESTDDENGSTERGDGVGGTRPVKEEDVDTDDEALVPVSRTATDRAEADAMVTEMQTEEVLASFEPPSVAAPGSESTTGQGRKEMSQADGIDSNLLNELGRAVANQPSYLPPVAAVQREDPLSLQLAMNVLLAYFFAQPIHHVRSKFLTSMGKYFRGKRLNPNNRAELIRGILEYAASLHHARQLQPSVAVGQRNSALFTNEASCPWKGPHPPGIQAFGAGKASVTHAADTTLLMTSSIRSRVSAASTPSALKLPSPYTEQRRFVAWVEELKAYNAKHEHMKKSEDKFLARFCENFRMDRTREERIASLDALGFDWTQRENPKLQPQHARSFDRRIEELKAYRAKHGHLNVKTSEDKGLAQFCNRLRLARRCPGTGMMEMTEERIAALDALGFDWTPRERSHKSSKQKVEELKADVKQSEDRSLTWFCDGARKGKRECRVEMTAARIASLDAVGGRCFVQRLEALTAYKARHGHLNVKKSEDKSLARFCQRARQARRCPGERGGWMKMTEARIASLDALGFNWAPRENPKLQPQHARSFDRRVEELKAYRAKHGHLNVKTSEDKGLAQICNRFRLARRCPRTRMMEMTEDRIASLDALGFDWEAQRGHKDFEN